MLRTAAAALVGAAIAAAPTAAAPSSGLFGVVRKGPTQPVCTPDVPCTAPAKHLRLELVGAGRDVVVTTGADGSYRIALAAGRYAVRVAATKNAVKPATATVVRGRFSRVNFLVDTHIR